MLSTDVFLRCTQPLFLTDATACCRKVMQHVAGLVVDYIWLRRLQIVEKNCSCNNFYLRFGQVTLQLFLDNCCLINNRRNKVK